MNYLKRFLLIIVGLFGGLMMAILLIFITVIGYYYIKYPDCNCENKNPIFEKYSYNSKEYKSELIRLLKDNKHLETKYWYDHYDDSTHIAIQIQSDSLCAIAYVSVLENFVENDGNFLWHL